MEPYSAAGGVVPRMLVACGHAFCEACLDRMLEPLALKKGRKRLPCPTVRAAQGLLSALSVFLCKLCLYGVFVWARRALNSQKRWFLARAVPQGVRGEGRAGGGAADCVRHDGRLINSRACDLCDHPRPRMNSSCTRDPIPPNGFSFLKKSRKVQTSPKNSHCSCTNLKRGGRPGRGGGPVRASCSST